MATNAYSLASVFTICKRVFSRLRWVLTIFIGLHVAAGLSFSWIQDERYLIGQYWATVTGATVGYGDYLPKTDLMMLITMVYIWFMALLWVFLTGLVVATFVVEKNVLTHEEQERSEAATLQLCKDRGIIPDHFTELPPTSWWKETYGFKPDEEESMA